MMQADRSRLATCTRLLKIYYYIMKPGKKRFLSILIDPIPSVTSQIKALFWLQVSSYIEETGYMMQ